MLTLEVNDEYFLFSEVLKAIIRGWYNKPSGLSLPTPPPKKIVHYLFSFNVIFWFHVSSMKFRIHVMFDKLQHSSHTSNAPNKHSSLN
jgi:hypothetical protein